MAACFLSSEPPPSGLGRTGCRLILTSDTMPLAIPAVLVVVAASASGCAERRAPAYLHKHVYYCEETQAVPDSQETGLRNLL